MLRSDDRGFTLVEVGLVCVILSLLSGIAIPTFLHQSRRAHVASADSDLRNAATAMEAYYADHETYGTAADLDAADELPRLSRGTTVIIAKRSGTSSYCLAALRNVPVPATAAELEAAATSWWDSAAGGLQGAGSTSCPTTTGYDGGWQTDIMTGPVG